MCFYFPLLRILFGYRMDVESNSRNTCTRKNGKSFSRHQLGFRFGAPKHLCIFRMVLVVENIGFGIHVLSCNKSDKGHPKVKDDCVWVPQPLLSLHEKMAVLHSVNGDLKSCHSRNYVFNKTGIFISRQKIWYMRDEYLKKIGDDSKKFIVQDHRLPEWRR